MNNEYYIPEIEDIHVGYECELFVHKGDYDNRWVPFTLTPFTCKEQITSMSSSGNWRDLIRTPYLTAEQIEKEGWSDNGGDYLLKEGVKDDRKCIFYCDYPDNGYIEISYNHITTPTIILYSGRCPSINEFRKITKLLGI